jgi:Tfp pilus assembly protein PilO
VSQSARRTRTFGVLALAALSAALWQFVLGPQGAEPERIREQAMLVALDASAQDANAQTLAQKAEELPAAQELAKKLAVQLPPNASDAELYSLMVDIASSVGLLQEQFTEYSVSSLDPMKVGAEPTEGGAEGEPAAEETPEAPEGEVLAGSPTSISKYRALQPHQMEVSVGVQGGYEQVVAFAQKMHDLDRLVVVDTMSLTVIRGDRAQDGTQGPDFFQITLKLRAFVAQDIGPAPSMAV